MAKRKKTAVILHGSPRTKGNTSLVLEWFENAIKRRGYKVRRHNLYRMNFRGCAHCDHCKGIDTEPACKLKDDFRPVQDQLVQADVIVVSSPVYCWAVSGCTSAALDRFYCLSKDSGRVLLEDKKVVGVFTAGGDAFDGMELCVDMLRRIADHFGAEYVGTLAAPLCEEPAHTRKRKDLRQAAADLAAEL